MVLSHKEFVLSHSMIPIVGNADVNHFTFVEGGVGVLFELSSCRKGSRFEDIWSALVNNGSEFYSENPTHLHQQLTCLMRGYLSQVELSTHEMLSGLMVYVALSLHEVIKNIEPYKRGKGEKLVSSLNLLNTSVKILQKELLHLTAKHKEESQIPKYTFDL
eukprot:TRINITY_DN3532_c0_g2_i1.p1 TRINITY_DN3532_c0_g2~~TRINITY_DN3532_c0_g2_i1.p1  ORF type:complete len:161 (-),score=25.23 TRINITY_DN3532_c0_g2_i1:20-502(-)